MLVLSRKKDQQIVVGNNITITILKIRGNTVRLGINAPHDVPVMRGELIGREDHSDKTETKNGSQTIEFRTRGDSSGGKKTTLRLVPVDQEKVHSGSENPPIAGPQVTQNADCRLNAVPTTNQNLDALSQSMNLNHRHAR